MHVDQLQPHNFWRVQSIYLLTHSAVVARNIHRIGAILLQQEIEREKREIKYADQDTTYKLAA